MTGTGSQGSKRHETLILGAFATLATTAGLTYLAGWCCIRLAGERVPAHRALAGLQALGHFSHPELAWHVRTVGPVADYWSLTGLFAMVALTLALMGWKVYRGAQSALRRHHHDKPHHKLEGLASRAHVVAHAGSRKLLAEAKHLRPSIAKPKPEHVGFRLGMSQGRDCWSGVRDSIIVVGPPGAGKGFHLAIPMILDAPGAVITTSTRTDNLAVTMAARSKVGPVAVFDPEGLAPGVPSAAKWSPARGCQRIETAMARAAALVSDSTKGTADDAFWRLRARDVTRCLLHAAALDERPTADLYRWSLSPDLAVEAIGILRVHCAELSRAALESVIAGDPKIRDGTWSCLANTLGALASPSVLAAVSPAPGQAFDPESFLRDNGTLYLLGTSSEHMTTANLISALIDDVIDSARHLAAVSPNARLDPPLTLVLDEAANYPLPSLPELMSEGGGSGLTTMAVLQSLAQARDAWGRDKAQAIWDATTVKVLLGGQANADDLADISKLLGDVEVEETSTSDRSGEQSTTTSTRHRPILTPAQLRTLPFGTGVLLLRSAPPIVLALSPWTARPEAKALTSAKTTLEESLRLAALPPAPPPPPVASGEWGTAAQIPVSETTGASAGLVRTAGGPPAEDVAAPRASAGTIGKPGQLTLGLDALVGRNESDS